MDDFDHIFKTYKRVAVVGLSPEISRPSFGVTQYMISAGFEIVGVRPGSSSILGRPCYSSLSDIPKPLEIVNVFRNSDAVPDIVDETIKNQAKVLWLQEGVTHAAAEKKARDHGILVVSDRCILKEHRRWLQKQ